MAATREKVIQQAERLVARGKVEAAIREYRKVLADNPRDTNTLNRVGDLYARLERHGEAITLFVRIAEHYTDDGFFVKAIAIYKKIIKLDPTRLDIYERLAELYHRQGLVNEARTQYQVLADYFQKHNDAPAATAICRRMVQLEPGNPSHRARLADLLEQQGAIAEAIGEYRTIAGQLVASGQWEGATRVWEKALDIDPENHELLRDAIQSLRAAGQDGAAARLLAAVTKRNPGIEQRLGDLGHGLAPSAPPVPEKPVARELPLVHPRSKVEPAPPPPAAVSRPAPPPRPEPPAFVDDHGGRLAEESQPHPRQERPPEDSPVEMLLEEDTAAGAAPPEPVRAPPPVEFDLDLDEVFVFDLDDDATPASQVAPPPDMLEKPPRPPAEVPPFEPSAAGRTAAPPPPAVVIEAPASEAPAVEPQPWEVQPEFDFADERDRAEAVPDLDIDLLERTAAELEPRRHAHEDDLLTEAEVLAKYGMRDKALERLEEVFRINPNHLGAYAVQIGLYLEMGRHERVVMLANEMGAIAAEMGNPEPWQEVRERLLAAGFRIEGERRVTAAPGAAVAEPEVRPRPAEPPVSEEPLVVEAAALPEPHDEAPAAVEHAPLPALEPEPAEIDLSFDGFDAPALAGEPWSSFEGSLPPFAAEAEEQLPPLELFEEVPFEKASEPPAPPAAEVAAPAPPLPVEAPASAPAPKKKAPIQDLDATLAQIAGSVRGRPAAARPAKPVSAPPPPPAPVAAAEAGDLFDLKSIGADIEAEGLASGAPAPGTPAPVPPPAPAPLFAPPSLAPEPAAEAPPAPPELPEDFAATADDLDGIEIFAAEPVAPALDEADLSWLDEASAQAAAGPAADQKIFEAEEGFFNLAAELEEELRKEEAIHGESLFAQPHEQSLEEIVEGFKRGVAEHLSPEDYETHFNLGIAYREMGLLDEAIGEFQLSAKHPDRLVDCCSMLGMCFIDKGLPELAVKWYKRGLDNPALSENESLGLLYELGSAYLLTGERDSAYKTFVDIYGVNTNYRDVVARLEELGR